MAQIVGANRLAQRSRVVSYDVRLRMRAITRDIYTYAEGIYNRKNQSWPEGSIKVKVKDHSNSSAVITLKEPLSQPGVYGQTAARGTEEPVVTRDVVIYQANYRKVIPKPGYGLRKLESDKYKLYDQHEKDLVPWNKEEHGYQIRKGFVARYGPNLLQGDTAAVANPWWNPNIFVPTRGIYQQPAFSRNRATHTNNICNAIVATGGFGQSVTRTMTAPVIEDLSNWCLNPRRLWQLKIPGLPTGMGFVVTVSEIMAGMMANPTFVANNLGSQWISYARLPEKLLKWPGVIGSYNNMLFVVDERQPTLLPSGSAAPYTLQDYYMVWNSRDLRQRSNANIKDTAFIHGEGSCVEMEGEPLHWISDAQDYDFRKGVGTAGVRGCQLPIYLDPNSQQVVYQGGAMAILDFPNRGSQAS